MICIKCKKEIPDGSPFCNWCGKKQVAQQRKSRKRANSQGSVYKLSGNRTKPYAAVLPAKYDQYGNKSQKYLGYYASKTEALNALNNAVSNNVTDRVNITLEAVYNDWSELHYRDISNSTSTAYKAAWKYFSDYYSDKIKDVKAADIQKCIDYAVSIGKSRATCEKIRTLYSQLCQYAMSLDIITQNYAHFLKMPPNDRKEKEIFTINEIHKIQEQAASDDTAKIIMILFFTGLRIGELFDILNCNVFLDDMPPRMIGGKKTEAGKNRIIPIHSAICGYIKYFYKKGNSYLISQDNGIRMNENNFRKHYYYPLLKQLDIKRKTPHTTRHTFATMMQASGAKQEDLIKVIGHADYSTTTENYIHQNIDTLYNMIELLKI